MEEEIKEVVLKKVKLREELKPVQIYMGDPPTPIDPDWVAVTHATAKNRDSFNLVFLKVDGTPITWEQFETIEIATDQARAILGIEQTEWSDCEVEITRDDGGISWMETEINGQQSL